MLWKGTVRAGFCKGDCDTSRYFISSTTYTTYSVLLRAPHSAIIRISDLDLFVIHIDVPMKILIDDKVNKLYSRISHYCYVELDGSASLVEGRSISNAHRFQ